VDWLEPIEQTVRREIAEELSLTLHELDLLCVVDQIDPRKNEHRVAPLYLTHSFEGEPCLLEPEKHPALGWFAVNRRPKIPRRFAGSL